MGWFEGRRWKCNNKWLSQPSKLLCKLYGIQGVSRVKVNILTREMCHFEENSANEHVSKSASVTGILGSSPDMDRRFRFKPSTGSLRQIPLAVNGLIREHSRRCEGC